LSTAVDKTRRQQQAVLTSAVVVVMQSDCALVLVA